MVKQRPLDPLAAAPLALAGLLGGCTLITDSFLTNEFSGDPYPIQVDSSHGAMMVGVRQAAHADRQVVLDLLSPFTLLDPGPEVPPSLSYIDLTLLGVRPGQDPAEPTIDLPRAQLPGAQVVSLHPCSPEIAPCTVGPGLTPQPFEGILGADVLAGDAVRLRLGSDQIFLLPDIGGSNRQRSLNCDAVFDSPYRGGGTLVFSREPAGSDEELPTTELPFGNRRITLQACLGPDAEPAQGAPLGVTSYRPQGADVLLVVSTSIGVSLLGEAAYARYRIADPDAKPLAELEEGSVFLPSGKVKGRLATINRLALVAASTSNPLAPCRQVYAHRVLSTIDLDDGDCRPDSEGNTRFDCPCEDDSAFCPVPGILELTPSSGIQVLVIPDTNDTLQALRTELRPDQPEVDGLIGIDLLRAAEIDVDYPHDRLLARCAGAECSARPQLAQPEDLCQINQCIRGTGPQPGCKEGPSLPKLTDLQPMQSTLPE